MRAMPSCAVCGGTHYADRAVLWDALVDGWGISPEERALVDRQQGTCCTGCGGNLRSIALAEAIMAACDADGTLRDFVASGRVATLRLLEINEAGTLSSTLRRLPGHVFGAYPALDMQAMHFADGSFDLIVHSDTLEHVPDPARALAECARVLVPDGALCFTIPLIPGRMSVSRAGLPPIFHGDPSTPTDDLLVHTDYGADAWHRLHQAGFAAVTLSRFDDGLAITARRRTRRRPAPVAAPLRALASAWRQARESFR
jgi:SAM-dependent methyltransferase